MSESAIDRGHEEATFWGGFMNRVIWAVSPAFLGSFFPGLCHWDCLGAKGCHGMPWDAMGCHGIQKGAAWNWENLRDTCDELNKKILKKSGWCVFLCFFGSFLGIQRLKSMADFQKLQKMRIYRANHGWIWWILETKKVTIAMVCWWP